MSLYKELQQAIDEEMLTSPESEEFKRRFSKGIENIFDNSFQDNDIAELIELVHVSEDELNGN